MQDDDMELRVFSSEINYPDVYDNKSHGYRYSGYLCSSETRISCLLPKFLGFFPFLLPLGKSQKSRKD